MAGRKKKDDESRFTAVIVENLTSQFKVFGEALQGLTEKVDAGFERTDRELALVKTAVLENSRAIGELRAENAEVRGEIGEIRGEIGEIRGEIGEIRGEIGEIRGEIGEIRGTVTRIEVALEKKVDRDEVEAIVARAIAR